MQTQTFHLLPVTEQSFHIFIQVCAYACKRHLRKYGSREAHDPSPAPWETCRTLEVGARNSWAGTCALLPGSACMLVCAACRPGWRSLGTPWPRKHLGNVWGVPHPYLDVWMQIKLLHSVFTWRLHPFTPRQCCRPNNWPWLFQIFFLPFVKWNNKIKASGKKGISIITLAFSRLKRTIFPLWSIFVHFIYPFSKYQFGENLYILNTTLLCSVL